MGKTRSLEFQANRRKLLSQFHECQLCGNSESLEVHHKVPLVFGGNDSMNNLIVICQRCHDQLHSGTRSLMTKIGLRKAMYDSQDWLLSYIDLLHEVGKVEEPIEVEDVLDIAEDLAKNKDGLTFKDYKEIRRRECNGHRNAQVSQETSSN